MSGDLPVNAECVPFRQIPHSTRLFLDYLSYLPSVQRFYPRSPVFSEWLKQEAPRVQYERARREKVSEILARQNRVWSSSERTFRNIDRLKRGALAAVTGQQVGLFGGPLFSLFKALSAVKLATESTSAGVDCVPVFWLATEDHDLAEVNHAALISAQDAPERLATTSHSVPDAPVGTITFGPEITPVVEQAASLLENSEIANWLREAYRPGETLGSSFARLFARMFVDWGVILLDPADQEFHALAKPLFCAAIEHAPEIDHALLERGKLLEAAGYHQQVKVTPATTLLFEIRNGSRTVVRRKGNGIADAEFQAGLERISRRQLLDRIEAAPQNFSPNVLFRPVMQDYLLPTLAYTGGAAEVAYFAQVAVVYENLLRRVTPVLPRFSATLVEPKAERILKRYQLGLTDLFHGPEKVRELIAVRSLPSDLEAQFSDAHAKVEQSMTALRDAIRKLDSTLSGAADHARMKMWHQINRLQTRAARAELMRSQIIARHGEALSNALFPHKVLQEREIAGVSFLARYGPGLLANLYDTIRTDCHDHQVITLQ